MQMILRENRCQKYNFGSHQDIHVIKDLKVDHLTLNVLVREESIWQETGEMKAPPMMEWQSWMDSGLRLKRCKRKKRKKKEKKNL